MFIKKLTKQVVTTYDKPIVKTKAGKIRGLIAEGTYIFRGIKYATAKRFHMPEQVTPWEGVRDAKVYGYICPQLTRCNIGGDYIVRHLFYPQDEDCLSLNIWTQSIDHNSKKPVMFWLHGGGFDSGSSIEHYAYDGEEMSKFADVVVVTVNHRLNVLGYLDLSAYGDDYKHSGNLGQADIISALRWVRDNIAKFGGDPNNVTIFGQSGGGAKVTTLMQMPAADGLYHRAIIMSGVMGKRKIENKKLKQEKPSRKIAKLVLKYAGVSPSDIEKLESIPYYELAKAANRALADVAEERSIHMGFGPVADGEYYVGNPFDVGFRSNTKNIPLMVGSVISEFESKVEDKRAVGSKYKWSKELKIDLIRNKFKEDAENIVNEYKKAYPERNIADLLYMDSLVRKASIDFVSMRAESSKAKTFNYLYCLEMPFNEGTTPSHNCDIPYVFHNAQYLEAFYTPGITEKVQDMICSAFVNFANNGDPNGIGIPNWEAVTNENIATMIFDIKSKCVINHDKKLVSFLPAVFPNFEAPKRDK